MSHFYVTATGQAGGVATCRGSKRSGAMTQAASWNGGIEVTLSHDKATGEDRFTVCQVPWYAEGIREVIAEGILGQPYKADGSQPTTPVLGAVADGEA